MNSLIVRPAFVPCRENVPPMPRPVSKYEEEYIALPMSDEGKPVLAPLVAKPRGER